MPQVCRRNDLNSAGGVAVANLASTVTINGLEVALVGTVLTPDSSCEPIGPPHCSPVIIQGSSSVSIEGRPVAYVGCSNDCGHQMVSGSSDVTVGY